MPKKLLIVTSPPGAGKRELVQEACNRIDNLVYLPSYTTRQKRPHEIDGKDYHFVSKQIFHSMIEQKLFLECDKVHGNWYGTLNQGLLNILKSNSVILSPDVRGSLKLLQIPKSIGIFITISDTNRLYDRIKKEETNVTQEDMIDRMIEIAESLNSQGHFKYIFYYNNRELLKEFVDLVKSIILE